MREVVIGLARRMRIPYLVERHDSTVVMGLFALVNGLISIGLMSLAALVTGSPLTAGRVGAAAMSLGLTAGLMVWFKVPHPPAGATTLIVSLGILRTPSHLVVLMVAVVLLTIQGFVINRMAGLDYPRWAAQG